MKRIIYILLAAAFLYACNGGNKEMLLGTWRSVKIDNPEVDQFFVNSRKYIDTVGKNNDAATNIALYGVANMDSMRVVLRQQYDSVRLMQSMADTQTVFRFGKDSIASLVFPDRTEDGKWYFDKEGMLVLEGAAENGEKETTKVQVMLLSKDSLRLKFIKIEPDITDTSYVTFHREGK